jgi:hypothetical protein
LIEIYTDTDSTTLVSSALRTWIPTTRLTPYGYTNALPKDYNDHMKLCEMLKPVIQKAGSQAYDCGPALTTIYQANGIVSDWTYDALGAKYSFAVELRGTDFVVSPYEIAPNGAEIFAAAKVMGSVILQVHNKLSRAPSRAPSRALLSYTPLILSSHTLLSFSPLIHSSHTLLSYTPLIHSSHTGVRVP